MLKNPRVGQLRIKLLNCQTHEAEGIPKECVESLGTVEPTTSTHIGASCKKPVIDSCIIEEGNHGSIPEILHNTGRRLLLVRQRVK